MIADEKIIKEKLFNVGINIENIYDLVNSNQKYPKAIEVLIELLNKDYDFDSKTIEGIIRSLAVKEAKGKANNTLFSLYKEISENNNYLKWVIGNTINVIVQAQDEEKIIQIITDKTNQTSRQMFVLALSKIKFNESEEVLINLLDDDQVCAHTLDVLEKLKSKKAIPKIKELLNHNMPLVRKEANKALTKINT